MASSVALPLEKQFATIAGLNAINSTSSQGSTNITLQFDLSRNIDAAAQDVQAMIAKAARSLPPQMPAPPSYQKVNPGDQPVIFLVLHSPTLPLSIGRRVRRNDHRAAHLDGQRRRAGAGVRRGEVRGAHRRRPAPAGGHGHRHRRSRRRPIQNANVNLPTGTMYGSEQTFTVLANGQLFARRRLRAD